MTGYTKLSERQSVAQHVKERVIVPVVSSTHYDREWRFSFQQTRSQLRDLIDHLLDLLDTQPDFPHYQLDGQSIILEDYLGLRRDRENDIKRLMQQGKLSAGPWYTLPDMNCVGGESIIRNLLIGKRVTQRFGPVMQAGYTATGFGQISQLPQIYAGFGIDTAFFYRGPDRSKLPKEFLWESPDGSRVIAYTFTPEFGRLNLFFCITRHVLFDQAFYEREQKWNLEEGPFRLDDDRTRWDLYYLARNYEGLHTEELVENVRKLIDTETCHSSLDTFLVMDGSDSTEAQPKTPAILEEMNKVCTTHEFVQATLEDFADILRKQKQKLPVFRGEMHTAAKHGIQANLYGDTLTARIDLKSANAQAERKLIHWAEPFAAFAWCMGAEYPRRMLDEAWSYLLQNQCHDSIGGCGQDIVHRQMNYKYSELMEIADEATRISLYELATCINTDSFAGEDMLITVFNPQPRAMDAIIEAKIDIPSEKAAKSLRIATPEGALVPHESLAVQLGKQVLIHRPKDAPGMYCMDRWRVRFHAKGIPGCGWSVFKVAAADGPASFVEAALADAAPECVIENEYMRLSVSPNGAFNLYDKERDLAFLELGGLADRGEAGNVYSHARPENDCTVQGPNAGDFSVLISKGALASTLCIQYVLFVPETSGIAARASETVPISVRVTATLHASSRYVELKYEINNEAHNHQLRVMFPTGFTAAKESIADMPFDILKRAIQQEDTSDWFERGYPNHPMRHFCAVADERAGLAVATRGLSEYEVLDDHERTIAITLLRCVQAETPKLKEPDESQLDSQMLGAHVFEFAIIPFDSPDTISDIYEIAQQFVLPPRMAQIGKQRGALPPRHSFLTISKPFALSAIKANEQGNALIVRVWNVSPSRAEGELRFGIELAEAWRTSLSEERSEAMQIEDGKVIRFCANPHEIVTMEVWPVHHAGKEIAR